MLIRQVFRRWGSWPCYSSSSHGGVGAGSSGGEGPGLHSGFKAKLDWFCSKHKINFCSELFSMIHLRFLVVNNSLSVLPSVLTLWIFSCMWVFSVKGLAFHTLCSRNHTLLLFPSKQSILVSLEVLISRLYHLGGQHLYFSSSCAKMLHQVITNFPVKGYLAVTSLIRLHT